MSLPAPNAGASARARALARALAFAFAVASAVALALTLAPSPAAAQAVWPYRIGVMGPAPIYSDPTAEARDLRTPQLSYPALTRELEAALAEDVRFALVDEEALRLAARAAVDDEQAEYIDLLRDNGIEQFALYEIDSSIDSLRRAAQRYRDAGLDFVRPREVATTWEYLARAYLEQARVRPDDGREALAEARRAFKEVIRLTPNPGISRDAFPDAVVDTYEEAYLELLLDDGRELVMGVDRAVTVGARFGLDYLVAPFFVRDTSGARLVLHIVDVRGRSVAFRETIPLTAATETSRDAVSRAISRFVACAPLRREPEPPVMAVDAGRVFLSAGWGFTFYGERPTADQFLNQGVALQAGYQLTENLGVFGRAAVLFGSRDASGDLLEPITSVRSAAGMLFSLRVDWFRPWLGTGVEVNWLGAYRATDEFWCKVSDGLSAEFGAGQACRASDVTREAASVQVGAYLMPGLSFGLTPAFSLYLNGNFGFYLTDSGTVDFPLAGESGIEYRF
jgi:tetratricopeptide (TPR) repeat protein